jgi:hypothetical protein
MCERKLGGEEMKLIPITIAALTLATAASAGVPTHPGQANQASLWTKLCAKRQTLKTRSIPATAQLQSVNVLVNGHYLRGWNEAPRIAGLGGYGVVAQITFTRAAGPAIVRLASVRERCARVHILIVWR